MSLGYIVRIYLKSNKTKQNHNTQKYSIFTLHSDAALFNTETFTQHCWLFYNASYLFWWLTLGKEFLPSEKIWQFPERVLSHSDAFNNSYTGWAHLNQRFSIVNLLGWILNINSMFYNVLLVAFFSLSFPLTFIYFHFFLSSFSHF